MSGRLIFIPAINLPAVAAARRTSPLDDLNFNRAFPGDPLGSPTQQIVAYVNDVLFPLADAFLDLHSGGSPLAIIPSAIIEPVVDPERHARNKAATLAFGAPMTVAIDNRGDPRTATASAARAGLTVVGTEMAGGEQFRSTPWLYVDVGCAMSLRILACCRRRWQTRRNPPRRSTTSRGRTLRTGRTKGVRAVPRQRNRRAHWTGRRTNSLPCPPEPATRRARL